MATKAVAKGITRFDLDSGVSGYMVRTCRKGKKTNDFFSDSKYGGKRKALAAAKQKYEELQIKLGPAKHATLNKITARNTSGHVGVHLDHTVRNESPDFEYFSYVASWTEDGKRVKTKFSCDKYGKKAAFEMACLARKKKITDREKIITLYERAKKRKKAAAKKKRR